MGGSWLQKSFPYNRPFFEPPAGLLGNRSILVLPYLINFLKMKIKFFTATTTIAFAIAAFIVAAASSSCGKDDEQPKVDCSTVTGATFTTNSGKIAAILESKCGITDCHSAGGEGAAHWEWEADYATVQPHFDHMLDAVEEGIMPDVGTTPLTEEEKDQLLCWKEAGFPE